MKIQPGDRLLIDDPDDSDGCTVVTVRICLPGDCYRVVDADGVRWTAASEQIVRHLPRDVIETGQ